MKFLKNSVLILLVFSLSAPSALADIVLVKKGKPSGELIKVIREGSSVGFQLFSGGTYIKNLGNKNRYSIESIQKYNQSLPQKIRYDKFRRTLLQGTGTLIGIGAGVVVANLLSPPKGDSIGSRLGAFLGFLVYLGPSAIIGGVSGFFAGGKAEEYFFVGVERHELRATLTSPMVLEEGKIVLEVENPLEAAAELDAALGEIP
ncbi:hypothetical protein EB061_08225 [bacterium]|jgi:hypothetical protein|nr:hypothetical protein [bacterium]